MSASRSEQPDFQEFKVIKLPTRGPKPGQSVDSYLHGKRLGDAEWNRRRAIYKSNGNQRVGRLNR